MSSCFHARMAELHVRMAELYADEFGEKPATMFVRFNTLGGGTFESVTTSQSVAPLRARRATTDVAAAGGDHHVRPAISTTSRQASQASPATAARAALQQRRLPQVPYAVALFQLVMAAHDFLAAIVGSLPRFRRAIAVLQQAEEDNMPSVDPNVVDFVAAATTVWRQNGTDVVGISVLRMALARLLEQGGWA